MAKAELESKLQRRCQQIIKDNNAFVFKTHGNMFTRTGMPDLVACIPITRDNLQKMLNDGWFPDDKIGIFVGLEIKRENRLNELSKAQEIVGKEIKDAGGIWFAIDDSDIVHALMKTMKGEL